MSGPLLLGPAQIALMARQTSIIVGTRDARRQPHVVRAVGSRWGAEGRLAVLLPRAGSEAVLADLRDNRCIAVVFSEPTTHQTLQVKGRDAEVADGRDEELALAARYLEGFANEIGQLGFPAEVARTILCHDGDLVVVHFTPTEAYEQTPGPSAGAPLPPGGST